MSYICGENTSKLMLAIDALLVDNEVDESLGSAIAAYAYSTFGLDRVSEWSIDLFRKVLRIIDSMIGDPRMLMYIAEKVSCALEGDGESAKTISEILGIEPSKQALYYILLALVNKALTMGSENLTNPLAQQPVAEVHAL